MDPEQEFEKRLAAIHGLDSMPRSSRNIHNGIMDVRHEEFQAMADAFLGEAFDPIKLAQIEHLQTALHKEQAVLFQRYKNNELTAPEYVDSFNELLSATFTACEHVLGPQDFLKLFGAPPSQLAGFIDKEAFLRDVEVESQAKETGGAMNQYRSLLET